MAETTGRELRRTNLSAVLTLVHSRGSVSRAELTRETGLNRSTVGALVGELVDLRLVREAEPPTGRHVGRPSLLIEPERRTVALAVHPAADAVTIGVVGLGGQVIKRIRYSTVQAPRPDEVVNIVSAVVAGMRSELDASYSTIGVGLAVPGLVRSRDGVVDAAPHLGWHAEPLAERLEQALGLPVFAAGDAAAGALGESACGAARGVRNLVFLTSGAGGVSAAVIGAGTLLTGADGYAGALGHLLVNSGGALCSCGARGCLDTEVSPEVLLAALAVRRGGCADGADGVGVAPESEGELDAVLLRHRDDPAVQAVVDRQLAFLAVALRASVNLFDPELVVLGGYLGALHAFAPERLPAALARSAMRRAGTEPRLVRSALGDDLIVAGAAQLAFSKVLRDPARLATRAGRAR
jgi:predicted NBD/HSP70 family sugar kinase